MILFHNIRVHNKPSGCEADILRMCVNHDEQSVIMVQEHGKIRRMNERYFIDTELHTYF